LSKKFEPRKFELFSIVGIGPCHTYKIFTHMLKLHARNHGPTTQRGEWELNREELDPCIKRRWKGEQKLNQGEPNPCIKRRWKGE
jgi:uncharacterized lipoprotein YmbA